MIQLDDGRPWSANTGKWEQHLRSFSTFLQEVKTIYAPKEMPKSEKKKQNKTKQEERFWLVLQISAHKESMAQSQKKKWCQLNIKYSHSCLLINSKFFSVSISGKAYHIYVFCVIYRQWTVTELYKLKHLFNWNTELREVCFECCLVNTFGAIWINLFVFHMFGFCLLLRA